MHCVLLAILSALTDFHPPQLAQIDLSVLSADVLLFALSIHKSTENTNNSEPVSSNFPTFYLLLMCPFSITSVLKISALGPHNTSISVLPNEWYQGIQVAVIPVMQSLQLMAYLVAIASHE